VPDRALLILLNFVEALLDERLNEGGGSNWRSGGTVDDYIANDVKVVGDLTVIMWVVRRKGVCNRRDFTRFDSSKVARKRSKTARQALCLLSLVLSTS